MAEQKMLPPYPEYKDSGVEWIGEIPKSWKVTKIKYIAEFSTGWTPSTSDDSNFGDDYFWVNISDLKSKYISSTEKMISKKGALTSSMEIVPAGSLLYSFKLSVGDVSFITKPMYTNEAIASFSETGTSYPLRFFYYIFPKYIIQNASTNIYGARILNQERIKNALVVVPEMIEEADKIADFLDYETEQMDRLIAKQERLIELLKERRRALISAAVTGKIDLRHWQPRRASQSSTPEIHKE